MAESRKSRFNGRLYVNGNHMKADPVIIHAIQNKLLLQISYRNNLIIVEPHAYGLDSRGRASLLCYNVPDDSPPTTHGGWKLLNLADVATVTDICSIFKGPRHGYKRNDMAIIGAFIQL